MSLFGQSSVRKVIFLLLLWQLVSVYLMAAGVWPLWVAWLNFGLICTYILIVPAFEGLLLVLSSIAFYVVLPQHYSDTLSVWRPVVGVLFLKALYESLRGANFRATWQSAVSMLIKFRLPRPQSVARGDKAERMWFLSALLPYEKIGIALFILSVLSLALARYPLRGAAQLIFLLNTFLLYFVVVWVVRSRDEIVRLLKYSALSTGLIIALGYVQFIATLFSSAYYFWQYWALRVASLYYGLSLAKVLQYSNSWVTVSGETKTLRMFSIMTSSHAFAMVCVLFLVFAIPLFAVYQTRRVRAWLWAAVVAACLALIISGTRGVWVGMIPALAVAGVLYYQGKLRQAVQPFLAAMLIVVVLFEASPLLDRTFANIRSSGGEETLDRVASIVDVGETSNAGRLKMWKAASMYALRHPLGVGYANFVVTLTDDNSASFDQVASQENTLYRLPQRYITAHSLFLQLLVELSALGLLLFCILWLFVFYKAWQSLVSSQDLLLTTLVASAALACVWFLAYAMFDVTWLNDKILLYTFMLLGALRFAFTLQSNAPTK